MKFPQLILTYTDSSFAADHGDAIVMDGRPIGRSNQCVRRWGQSFWMTPTPFRMAQALLLRRGGIISKREVIDYMYGHSIDGGPLEADGCCSVYLCKYVRPILRQLGLEVETFYYQGWRAVPVLCEEIKEAA